MKKFLIFGFALLMLSARLPAQTGVSGNLTAATTTCLVSNSCIEIDIPQNVGGATLKLSGTFNAVVQFEASADPLTVPLASAKWVAISASPSDGTAASTSTTQNGSNLTLAWQTNVTGFRRVRLRVSTYTSGTVAAAINLSTASARAGGPGGGGGGSVTSCTTTGGVGFENGTSNTLTCDPSFTYDLINGIKLNNPFCLFGGGSGSACIGYTNTSNVPNRISLPTATGTLGQVLTTDGGNPQQTSWSNPATILDPNSTYAAAFGAKFDGRACYGSVDTIVTNGTTTVTCNHGNFTSADVGKQFTATNGCCGVAQSYTGVSLLASPSTATTITGVTNSTTITISQNASACTGATCIIAWATNDDTAISAAEAVWANSTICGSLVLPSGMTAVLQSHFTTPNANCLLGQEAEADYTAAITGTSIGTTVIGIFPGFNFASCTGGLLANACFGGYKEASWKNWGINGYGWGNTGAGSAKLLVETGLGSHLQQWSCIATGGSDANLIGVSSDEGTRVWGMVIDGCGKTGWQINGSIIKAYYCFSGDTLGPNVSIANNSDLTDYGCDYGVSGGTQVLVFNGNGSRYHGIGSNLFGNSATSGTAIYIGNTTNNTVILDGARWNNGATTSNGLFINAASDKVFLYGSILGGTSNGINFQGGKVFASGSTITSAAAALGVGAANSIFTDGCGNTLTGSIATTNIQTITNCSTGSDTQLAKATAQTAKTVFTVGVNTALFRAHISVECTTTSASATVTPAILYTDTSNTAQTVTGTAATCTTLNANSVTSQDVTFRAKNATAIQYQTTIANTPTYDVSVVVEQLTLN